MDNFKARNLAKCLNAFQSVRKEGLLKFPTHPYLKANTIDTTGLYGENHLLN